MIHSGQYQQRLRFLERSLLDALNTDGSILENDELISTLEKIKLESADIVEKIRQGDGVMLELENVTSLFSPFARVCSAIYFSTQRYVVLCFVL